MPDKNEPPSEQEIQNALDWADGKGPPIHGCVTDGYFSMLKVVARALRSERDKAKRIEADATILRQCLEQIKAEEVARMVGDGIPEHSIAEHGPRDGTKFTSRVLDLTKKALRSTPPEAAKP